MLRCLSLSSGMTFARRSRGTDLEVRRRYVLEYELSQKWVIGRKVITCKPPRLAKQVGKAISAGYAALIIIVPVCWSRCSTRNDPGFRFLFAPFATTKSRTGCSPVGTERDPPESVTPKKREESWFREPYTLITSRIRRLTDRSERR
jgi:hypothetical protein